MTVHILVRGEQDRHLVTVSCSCGLPLGIVASDPRAGGMSALRLIREHHRDIGLGTACGYNACDQPVADHDLGLCAEHARGARFVGVRPPKVPSWRKTGAR